MYKGNKWLASILVCIVMVIAISSASASSAIYSNPNNWAYYGNGSSEEQDADVFFVCPTVFLGSSTQFNMDIEDEKVRKSFIGAINMQKGIYDARCTFYAPYYRQAGLIAYTLPTAQAAPYFEVAYQDVKAAFEYYLQERKREKPLVLAGFSQGADMVVRLMKDMYSDDRLSNELVAAYVIGWRVTSEEIVQYPHLKMAQGECDTGVIISFNTEAPLVKTSILVPDKTLSINPLNWKTTSQLADKSLNKGAVFTDYDGDIIREIPHLTGAYIDKTRGTLKATDINTEEYPPVLDIFDKGVYHIYDYQFFYRNLQENVKSRIEAFKARRVTR